MRPGAPLLVVLALAAPASLAAVTPEVTQYLRSAYALYEGLDYDQALDQVHRAKEIAHGADDDVVIGLYEGIVLADLGRADDARTAFRAALSLQPDSRLPVKVSPKVAELFEQIRAEVAKALKPLPLDATPPSARVVAPPPPPAEAPSPWRYRAPLIAGAVLVAAGAACVAEDTSLHQQLTTGTFSSLSAAQSGASEGKVFQTVGWSSLGVGAAVLGLGFGLLVTMPSSPISASLGPSGVAVEGRF
jgi:tetratricopeptide (TPR) repeat protein